MKARYWRIRPEYTGPIDDIDYWHVCSYDMNYEWYNSSPLVIDSIKILDRDGQSLASSANIIIKSYPGNRFLECVDGTEVGYYVPLARDPDDIYSDFYDQTQDWDQAQQLMFDYMNGTLLDSIPIEYKTISPENEAAYQDFLDNYIEDIDMPFYRVIFNLKESNPFKWFLYCNGAHNSVTFDFSTPTDIGSLSLDFGSYINQFYNPDLDEMYDVNFRTNALILVECSNDGNVWYTVGYNNPSDFDDTSTSPRSFQFINPKSEELIIPLEFKYWGLKAFTWDVNAQPLNRVSVNEFKLLNEYGTQIANTDTNWFKYQDGAEWLKTVPGQWISIGPDDDLNSYELNYPVGGNANGSFTLPAACNVYQYYSMNFGMMSYAGNTSQGYDAMLYEAYTPNFIDRNLYLDVYNNQFATYNASVFLHNTGQSILLDGISLKFDSNGARPRRVAIIAGDDWCKVQPIYSKYEYVTGNSYLDNSIEWLPINMFSIVSIDNIDSLEINFSKLGSGNAVYNMAYFNKPPIKITPKAYEVFNKDTFLVTLEL